MPLITVLKNKTLSSFIGCAALAAALLFINLGRFGMWEPDEIAVVEEAEHIERGRLDKTHFQRVEARLATLGWGVMGRTELGSRLPVAGLAFLTVLFVFFALKRLGDERLAGFGTLFFIASPLLIYHGRQLTEGLPTVVGEIASLAGLSLIVFSKTLLARGVFGLIAAAGLALGCTTRGALVGVVSPTMAVAAALLLSPPCHRKSADDKAAVPLRTKVAIALGAIGVIFAGIYASILLFSDSDVPFLTGGRINSVNTKWTFDFALEQIVYSWFPWVALVPLSVVKFFKTDEEEAPERLFLRALVITGLLFGYLSQVISLDAAGLKPAAVALPIMLGIALAVDDITREKSPLRLMVFVSVALFALLIRDFAQNNQTVLYGFGFDHVPIPKKQFDHVIQAGLSCIPFALLLVAAFLADSRVRTWLFRGIVPLAPAFFGVGIAFVMIPNLSVGLSSKHAIEVYEQFKTEDEPLAVLGPNRFLTDTKKLKSVNDTVDWLSQSRRVFAMFPPDKLSQLDHKMRKKTGKHLHVLDAESDRFIVATSAARKDEKNKNPILPFVSSDPFEPGPDTPRAVNFDDVLTFEGWSLKSGKDTDRINKGKEMVFTSYWRVDERIPGDYKIFMHIDGPGGRLHGDHTPFEGRFPTSEWQKGDHIKETYRLKVPLYQGSGKYTIKIGLYKDSGRLRIKDEPTAKENSLFVTSLMLE